MQPDSTRQKMRKFDGMTPGGFPENFILLSTKRGNFTRSVPYAKDG